MKEKESEGKEGEIGTLSVGMGKSLEVGAGMLSGNNET